MDEGHGIAHAAEDSARRRRQFREASCSGTSFRCAWTRILGRRLSLSVVTFVNDGAEFGPGEVLEHAAPACRCVLESERHRSLLLVQCLSQAGLNHLVQRKVVGLGELLYLFEKAGRDLYGRRHISVLS
jgi:hypothetical protein